MREAAHYHQPAVTTDPLLPPDQAPPVDPPSAAPIPHDGVRRAMDRGWLQCEGVRGWIVTALVGGGTFVAMAFLVALAPMAWWGKALVIAGWGTLTASLVWSIVGYHPRAFRAMSWTPHPDRLEFREGVWWRRVITIPRTRVQHTDVTQGPLQRRCGIATLVVHTAGTAYAKVDIPGLAQADAEHLRDWLLVRNDKAELDV